MRNDIEDIKDVSKAIVSSFKRTFEQVYGDESLKALYGGDGSKCAADTKVLEKLESMDVVTERDIISLIRRVCQKHNVDTSNFAQLGLGDSDADAVNTPMIEKAIPPRINVEGITDEEVEYLEYCEHYTDHYSQNSRSSADQTVYDLPRSTTPAQPKRIKHFKHLSQDGWSPLVHTANGSEDTIFSKMDAAAKYIALSQHSKESSIE